MRVDVQPISLVDVERKLVGFLVDEDDEFVCLAQQVFNEDIPNIRFTVMIPKACIIDRRDINFFPKEESEEDLVIEE